MNRRVERRVVAFSAAQIFALVADVEQYPQFLPGWRAVRIESDRILENGWRELRVNQTIALGPLALRFDSRATLTPPERIDIESVDAPFGQFAMQWHFVPAAEQTCSIELSVQWAFRSRLMTTLAANAVSRRTRAVIRAFERRAHQRYLTATDN